MLRPLRLLQCQLTRPDPPSLLWSPDGRAIWGVGVGTPLPAACFIGYLPPREAHGHGRLIFFVSGGSAKRRPALLAGGLYDTSHGLHRRGRAGLDPAGMVWENKGRRLCVEAGCDCRGRCPRRFCPAESVC